MKIYLCGAMRGQADGGREAFGRAKAAWEAEGYHVFCPHAVSSAMGHDCGAEIDRGVLKHVMLVDVACVVMADAVALLPGWERSMGATVEVALAQFLGLPIHDAVTMQPIHVQARPWSCLKVTLAELKSALQDAGSHGRG